MDDENAGRSPTRPCERPWRVDKTMLAGTRGAVKLGRRYGAALVCVRYRLSPDGRERITTVELQVDRAPVQRRSQPLEPVHVYRNEHALAQKLKSHGAHFEPATRTWFVPRSLVHAFGLADRIALDHGSGEKVQVPPDGT